MLTDFDIIAASGSVNKAIMESFNATANSSGEITLTFTGVVEQAIVSGIEIDSP